MKITVGPGVMVAAAFVGPGTVTTASVAGASSGVSLLWAVAISVLATIVLQELSIRSALSTNQDLAPLIRQFGHDRGWGVPIALLILCSVGLGNAAYQSGNLAGAAMGLSGATPVRFIHAVVVTGSFAAGLILVDRYRLLERAMLILVGLMTCLLTGLAVACLPELITAHRQVVSNVHAFDATVVLALIGTTVVPYNLFLHATAVRHRWSGIALADALRQARIESAGAIVVGGVVTAAIMIVATVVIAGDTSRPALEALQVGIDQRFPDIGRWAMGAGLFAAGLTSAIAAPVAAGWAVCGVMGWNTSSGSKAFKGVALMVLAVGMLFAIFAARPVALIVLAQATNAVLLPLVALVLLAIVNSPLIPHDYRNGWPQNLIVTGVIGVVLLLAATKLLSLFG
ncbi:Nramp family divalent metal transporter [Luminiphilus sp.]|nr:Nramp family divalent metal transporter [Luminiphilus sp.]MDC0573374.1 Nramp family divalent metal transporter [Luminiphilus sp.]